MRQVSRCTITVILEQEHFQSFPEHWQWNVQQTEIGWKTVPYFSFTQATLFSWCMVSVHFPFFSCLFRVRWTQVNVNRQVIWLGMKWKSSTWTVDKMHLMRYYPLVVVRQSLVTVCGWWVSVFVVLISSVSCASSVLMLPCVLWVIYGSSATLWSKSIGHCRYRVTISFVLMPTLMFKPSCLQSWDAGQMYGRMAQ